jgi:hypothetical protein
LGFVASRQLTKEIETEKYAGDETLIVKIPFSLPYHPGNISFERTDAEIRHQGEFYRVVNQTLMRDTLYAVYIKDHRTSSLFRSLVSFVKSHSDSPVSKSALKLLKSASKYFGAFQTMLQHASAGWSYSEERVARFWFLTFFDSPVFSPPPELPPLA